MLPTGPLHDANVCHFASFFLSQQVPGTLPSHTFSIGWHLAKPVIQTELRNKLTVTTTKCCRG